MSELNLEIMETGEIISMRMGRHITQLARTGCTEQCIPCHFKEVWHRELDQGSVSAFLDNDTVLTDRSVPHGETLLADGRTMMPNGIIAEISRLSLIAESEFIAVYLTIRFPALECDFTKDIVERVLIDLDELWTTDPDGNPTINASAIGGYQPSGHRIGSLPTTPVTPRNDGRPRSSHRTPPPIYSPSRPGGHPQQVLAPIALLERPRSPPPPYSPAPSYTEQDSTLRTDELLDRPNDAIISSSEFLANLEYVLQPLAAHAPPTPVRHGRRRTRTSPLNRPARSRAIRIPPQPIEQAQPQEIAPLGQSPHPFHPNLRPTLVSPPTHQRLPQQQTRMGRPQPITRSPNNIQLDRFRLPSPDLVMPQTSFLSSEEDSDSSEPERGQPRFYMRHSPFSDETDIDFPDYSHVSPRTMPVDWYTSDTCYYPDSDELESSSSSSSSSYFSLNSDDNANNEHRAGSISSPTNIANYRARQREARRTRSDSMESFAVSDEFSDPDSDLLHL